MKCHDDVFSYDEFTACNIGFITYINAMMVCAFFEVIYRSTEMKYWTKKLGYWRKLSDEEAEKL